MHTALMVVRHGTVSAAAAALGVHRATVNRHIDVLELALAGVAPLVMPLVRAMSAAHPGISIEFIADARLAKLEHGEAHIAFRAGPKPEVLDYVVRHFRRICFGLYASRDYVERAGRPEGERWNGHRFVGSVGVPSRLPFAAWMDAYVAADAVALRASEPLCIQAAIVAGIGLGFLPEYEAGRLPNPVEILPPNDDWSTDLRIVTHGDLHRTEKVQTFLRFA